jgi:hypothetical protein
MGFFNTILEKLGIGGSPAEAARDTAQATPASKPMTPPATGNTPAKSVPAVDVVAKLEGLATKHKEKLNWQTSIVDLLKLLGIDSSLAARKELATELGCPTDKMSDSAQMNMWLHKTVLKKLANNGGNIPKELLD